MFEDAVFNVKYLSAASRPTVAYLRDARYFYRRRADGTSLTNSARHDPATYNELPRHGYLALLGFAPSVPKWIQNTGLSTCNGCSSGDLYAPNRCNLDATALERFHTVVRAILRNIDDSTLLEFRAVDVPIKIRLALIAAKGAGLPPQNAHVVKLDLPMQLMLLSYFTDNPEPEEVLSVDGVPVAPTYAKTISIRFFDRTWLYQRDLWVTSLRPVSLQVDGRLMPRCIRRLSGPVVTTSPTRVWRRYGRRRGAPRFVDGDSVG